MLKTLVVPTYRWDVLQRMQPDMLMLLLRLNMHQPAHLRIPDCTTRELRPWASLQDVLDELYKVAGWIGHEPSCFTDCDGAYHCGYLITAPKLFNDQLASIRLAIVDRENARPEIQDYVTIYVKVKRQ